MAESRNDSDKLEDIDKEEQTIDNDLKSIEEENKSNSSRKYGLRHPIKNSTKRLKDFNERTKQEALEHAQNINYEDVDRKQMFKDVYKDTSTGKKIIAILICVVIVFFVVLGIFH